MCWSTTILHTSQLVAGRCLSVCSYYKWGAWFFPLLFSYIIVLSLFKICCWTSMSTIIIKNFSLRGLLLASNKKNIDQHVVLVKDTMDESYRREVSLLEFQSDKYKPSIGLQGENFNLSFTVIPTCLPLLSFW